MRLFEMGDEGVLTVPTRPLKREEIEFLDSFQELLKSLYEILGAKRTRKRINYKEYESLKQTVQRYHNYPFASKVFDAMKSIDDKVNTSQQARDQGDPSNDISRLTTQIEKLFLTKQVEKALPLCKQLSSLINTSHVAAHTNDEYVSDFKNPLFIENPLFFRTTNWLNSFEDDDMVSIINRKIEGAYTYQDLPMDESNFQYIVTFIQDLKDNDKPVHLTAYQFNRFVRFKYRNDPKFNQLTKDVEHYLQSNNRDKIGIIARDMKNFPEYVKASQNSIDPDTEVYRGYPGTESSDQDIIATSLRLSVAKNFALQKGHMESERRSEIGTIETYKIGPDAVILDTRLFGGIYGEDEIVIYRSKAKFLGSRHI